MNSDINNSTPGTKTPFAVLFWGWLGVMPFVLLAAAILLPNMSLGIETRPALIAYGAIILTFMGGTHWGLMMKNDIAGSTNDMLFYTAGIAPSLLAICAVLMGGLPALVILMAGFSALLMYDLIMLPKLDTPKWYLSLRIRLTMAVVICLAIAATANFV